MRHNKLPLRRGRAREPKPRPPPHVVRDEIRSTAIEGDDGHERKPNIVDDPAVEVEK